MKTADIKAALRAKFCAPEWAIMFEVGDGTGMNQRRWADAVAMNLWPSRGMEIHGFEIKASRSDWLRELKNPAKAESVQRYCDRWWIVAPPGVVKDGELPPTWGLYEAKDGKLRQLVAAPVLQAQPVDQSFVAAMLRRASGVDADEVRAAVDAEVAKQREQDERRIQREIEGRTATSTELRNVIDNIERVSGIKLDRWSDSEQIGRAVRMVVDAGVLKTIGNIRGIRNSTARALESIDQALAALPPPDAGQEIDS